MCGITGILHFDNDRTVDHDKIKRMTDVIRHRGPDGEGYYINNNIGFGHRRLSIIDLSGGQQPMYSDDKNIVLVFNGEIYNYLELKQELKRLGHSFKSKSDTEVIIKAYQEWGTDSQSKFNGMWAFAIWDQSKKQLFLSRDRIGEKPLHYSLFDNTLIFASEIKSIFEYGVTKKVRKELIEVYLSLTNIPGPDTFYENVYKLKPGHYIVANRDGYKERQYWDLPAIDENEMLKDKEQIYEKFLDLFEDSIKIRMRADVPYGAFLSGGLDSSSITSVMAAHSGYPIETFTIGFPEKDFDESKLANLVSGKFNTNHHEGTVAPDTLGKAINRSVKYFDEPFGDSSAIPTHQVSKFAANQVKMVLTGDGGDEVLSGYDSYAGIKLSQLINRFPGIVRDFGTSSTRQISRLTRGRLRYKLNRISGVIETASLPFSERLATKSSYVSLDKIKKLTKPVPNKIAVEEFYKDMVNKIPYQDDFYKLMYRDLKYSLPDDYLVKVDRMSMANSLETRAPFLDYRLIEFMVNVDKSVKMQGWERKSVLRKTVGKSLPKELLNAPKKGFGVPLRNWFQDSSNFNHLTFNSLKEVCDEKIIDQIVSENRKGQSDSGNFIWTMIMLDKHL